MHEARIEAARRDGQDWVVLEASGARDAGHPFRMLEMHVPTGVAVLAAAERAEDGRLGYRTESYFVNRRTGEDLACGSRRWNVHRCRTAEELERAVRAAKEDVPRRFAGLIRVYRRQTGSR